MRNILIVVLCIMLVVVIGVIFVAKMQGSSKTTGVEALYDFSAARRMDLSEKVDATGNVVLAKNMDLYPAYEATVRRINIKTGDQVQKGDLLAVLDSPVMEAQWADANSNYRQAVFNLALAQKGLDRTKILLQAQGATIDELDTAQNKVDLYQEQVKAAQVKLVQVTNMPDGANFIDQNHVNILIRAPFTGAIAWISAKPGDKVTAQTLLISLAEKNSLEIQADVDESEIALIHPGQTVNITGSDQNQTKMNGVVTEVGAIGKEDAGVVTFPVKIMILGNSQVIKNGMSADVTILTRLHPNALAVPSEAVVERRGHMLVGLRQKGSVVYSRVEVGTKSGAFTEIISGLKDGEMIAVPKPKISKNSSQQSKGMHMGGFGR